MFQKSNTQILHVTARVLTLFLLSILFGAMPAFADAPSPTTESLIEAGNGMPPVGQKIKWANFTGAPTIPASTVGLWIWSEDVSGQKVLHIRSGSDGTAKTFTGVLKTGNNANFYDAALVNGTGDDSVTTPAYNELAFTLATTGGGEGVDVNWSGTWLYLDLYLNGAYVPSKIFTGAAAKATTGAPLGTRPGKQGLLTLPLTMLDGATSFAINVANGYFLYRDAQGRFHMRLTTTAAGDKVQYRGRIISEEAKFRVVREYRGDPRDLVLLTDLGKVVEFKFHTNGYLDGVDWVIKGKNKPDNMTFTLRMNGDMAAPAIALGANPFGTIKAFTFRLVE